MALTQVSAEVLNNSQGNITTVGTLIEPSFSGNITLGGRSTFSKGISETIAGTKNSSTGNVIHDFSTGSIWIHNSVSSNFTVDLTNVPTTNDRTYSIALILDQAGTAYIPSGFKINGSTQTIQWADNSEPSGNAGAWDVVSFTLIRTSDLWIVFGVLNTFGTS